MTRLLRIGLTGGIASGKTTVAAQFTALGVPVIDADEASRVVVAVGTPGLDAVAKRFGPSVIAPAGPLDRRTLRDLIFKDPSSRRDLEAILHPLIRAEMDRQADAAVGPYLIMAIPLLIENFERRAQTSKRFDRILVVDVEEEVQVERVMARDGSSIDQAEAILKSQATRGARLEFADDVILNSGGVAELRRSVAELHQRYLLLAEAKKSSET